MKLKQLLTKTLLVVALLVVGAHSAWADETIFSYTIVQSTKDNFSTAKDDTWNDYSATGGTLSLYYKSSKSSVARDGSEYYYNFGGGAASIKLTLSSGTFQKGDVVTVSFKSNSGSNNASYYVRTGKGSSTNQLTSGEVTSTKAEKSVTLDDNFSSLSSIYIERVSQGMYAYSVTVTRPVTHSVSAVTSTGTDTYGTVSAESTTVAEGGTTTITAVPASGYKVTNWAVIGTGATISPSGDSNSTTTTLTMGTTDATVTVTFGAAGGLNVTHTLTNVTATSGATGDDAATEGTEYTAVFAANSGYVLPDAIAVAIGGETATAGTAYTWNKATGTVTIGSAYVTSDIVITVTGEEAYTLTYDANGGTGSMDATVGKGSITLTANAYTKSGYTFMGWATSQDNADAGTVAYAAGAAYTLSATTTLYAVWAANDYSFTASKGSGTISSGEVVTTSTGGKMVYTPDDGGSPSLKYSTTAGINCLEFGGASQCNVTVTLNKKMQAGTIICLTFYNAAASSRGLKIANSAGTAKATYSETAVGAYTKYYTVTASDGIAGSNVFKIVRNNNSYLVGLTVVNCANEYVATIGSAGYASFSSADPINVDVEGLEAYIAKSGNETSVSMQQVTGDVAAGTGLVLKGAAGTYDIPVAASGTDYSATNCLWAITSEGSVTAAGSGYTNYVLAQQNGNVVFAPVTGENSVEVTAGHAALCLANPSGARAVSMVFDGEATGIENLNPALSEGEGAFYDLQGRRVAQPTKGLYIVNGKKVMIK